MEDQIHLPFNNDHDVMVALVTEFNATIGVLSKRMEDDHKSTLEIKTLLESNYVKLSERIDVLEDTLIKLDPKEIASLAADVSEMKQQWRDFNRAKHLAWVIASGGFLAIGYYLPFFISTIQNIMQGLK